MLSSGSSVIYCRVLHHGGIHLPQARVLYSDGKVSRNMPIGNAKDYAGIFKGKVIMPN